MAPCVLIVDEAFVRNVVPSELAARAKFGLNIHLLFVGPLDRKELREDLMEMGFMGFLSESARPATIRKAVRALAGGEHWAPRGAVSLLLQRLLLESSSVKLTPRESEILDLISEGYKNKDIGERLCISRETVRWHIRSLYSKIGAKDRLSAAFYAKQRARSRAVGNAPTTEPEEETIGAETGPQPSSTTNGPIPSRAPRRCATQ